MKRFFFVAALLGLLSLAGRAEAGLVDFAFSGGGISGSGRFITGVYGDQTFALASTGSVSGDPNITDLSNLVQNDNAPGTTLMPGYWGRQGYYYDDQLNLGSSQLLTFSGLLWSSGSVYANLYYYGGGGNVPAGYYFEDSVYGQANPSSYGTRVSVALLSVPEPSSLVLAGAAALAGLGRWTRRRRV
jgi:PEP-CTERM motif